MASGHRQHSHTQLHSHTRTHTLAHTRMHTHTHTHVGFYGLRGLSIGVMVFILCKLYVLLSYTYPTPNLALTWDGAFLFSLKKTHSVWFISVLNYGDTENVLLNHLLLVIPMSYPCHYTNVCHKPHKHAHTHTHTHTERSSIPFPINTSSLMFTAWPATAMHWGKIIMILKIIELFYELFRSVDSCSLK